MGGEPSTVRTAPPEVRSAPVGVFEAADAGLPARVPFPAVPSSYTLNWSPALVTQPLPSRVPGPALPSGYAVMPVTPRVIPSVAAELPPAFRCVQLRAPPPVPTASTFRFDVSAMARPAPARYEIGIPVVTARAAAEAMPLPTSDSRPEPQATSLTVRLAKIVALVAAAWLAVVLFLIVAYSFVNPPLSALMIQQRLSGTEIVQDWVAIEDVSHHIIRAVLLSEDGRFCQHNGVDYQEMHNAIERAGDGSPRGASTISMQVTKNLFLWPSKSYVRKAIEIPLTYVIEGLWSKRRIMEVYLNIAEWGPGIFGVEAASQFHFGRPASRLNEREAARLAVALPNPYARDAGDPGPKTQRLAADIQGRMRAAPSSQTACVTLSD